jgi:DNA-binding HxlR family transcriptional regulator
MDDARCVRATRRAAELQRAGSDSGWCNPATLKVRLDRIEQLGLLRRTVHSRMPPRTSYELTPAGVDLQRVIDSIDGWAREHLDVVRPRGEG